MLPRPLGPELTLSQRVLRGGPIRLSGYGFSLTVSFITISITLRHLKIAESGRLFAGLSALALANALSDLGLGNVGLRDYPITADPDKQAFLTRLATVRFTALILAMAPAVFLATLTVSGDSSYVFGMLLGGTSVAGTVLVATATIPLAHRLDVSTQSAIQVLQALSTLLTAMTLVILDVGMPLFFGVQIPGVFLSLLLLRGKLAQGSIPWPDPRQLASAKKLLSRGVLLFGSAAVVGVAFYRIGAIAVAALADDRVAGEYGTAFRIADVIEGAAPLLMGIVLPIMAVSGKDATVRFASRTLTTLKLMAPLGAGLGACVFGCADLVVSLVGGREFEGAARPLQVLSAVVTLSYFSQVYGYALLSLKRHAAMLVAVLIGLTVTGIALVAMVPMWGAQGGAYSLLAGQTAIFICYGAAFARTHGLSGHAPTVLRSMSAYAIAVIAAALTPGLLLPPVVAGLVIVVLLGAPVRRALTSIVYPGS